MKRLYYMVGKELLGPWVFGVAIFTTLVMTGTYLFKFTDYVTQGVSLFTVMYMTLLVLPAILVKTLSMSVLLAALLAFGRLSSDSEIVALRAAGISVGRIMVPVGIFGFLVAVGTFILGETVAPACFKAADNIKSEIAKQLKTKNLRPVGYPVWDNKALIAQLNARDFNPATQTLRGVTVIVFDRNSGTTQWFLEAAEMQFVDEKNWQIRGGGRLISADGTKSIVLDDRVWPDFVPKMEMTPADIVASLVRDQDTFSMKELKQQIEKAKRDKVDQNQIVNLEYFYYNKMAFPLAAFIFGLLGAPLGIRNHRTGAAAGYMVSIAIIFGYYTMANLMAIYANKGGLDPVVASFAPVALGFILAVFTIRRRNL